MELKHTISLMLLLFSTTFLFAQKVNTDTPLAWQIGEELTYRVFYQSLVTGQVNAGEAITTVEKRDRQFDGRSTYNIVGLGKSKGAFNFFFKVRDRFETFIDREHLTPYLFIRRTREGGYRNDDDVSFDQKKHIATSKDTSLSVPKDVHDFVSALFYARNLPLEKVQADGGFPINFFLDDTTYRSWVKYEGIEVVETQLGQFRCIKLAPMAATGKVFSNKYPMFVWVTADKNRLPILVSSAVIIGNVKIELIEFEGLKYPMDAKLE